MSISDDENQEKVSVQRTRTKVPAEERSVVVDSATEAVKPNVPRRRRAYAGGMSASKLDFFKQYVPNGYVGRLVDPRLIDDRQERGWEFVQGDEGGNIDYTMNNGKDAPAHKFVLMIKKQEYVDEDNKDRKESYNRKLRHKGKFGGGGLADDSIGYTEDK